MGTKVKIKVKKEHQWLLADKMNEKRRREVMEKEREGKKEA